ncbi:MAG: hypothetical protein JSW11_13660 [Candidatus Heimdallarchaeota archaeon]|nr:MAG: hypothetical protein JSW11_13660 [Candidatus Heimdallarchaeota archaeon]
MMWGKYTAIVTILFLIFGMMITKCSANVLPASDDAADGGLLPDRLSFSQWLQSNRSIFLKAETINVTLDQEKAHVNALYILKNEAVNETSLDIALPFSRTPSNVQLMIDGKEKTYSWNEIKEIIVPHTYPATDSVHSINDPKESIGFSLSFNGSEEKRVHVMYQREYTITDGLYDHKIVSEFRYIIGTSRWWKYPLESAHFEFWVLKRTFDKGTVVVLGNQMISPSDIPFFINSTTKDYVGLSVDYRNWMPVDQDFLVLYWERAKPFFDTRLGTLVQLGGVFISCTIGLIGSIWVTKRFKDHTRVKYVSIPAIILFLLLTLWFLLLTAIYVFFIGIFHS